MFENAEIQDDWNSLVELFAQVDDRHTMERLFLLFLTINEREYLVGRYRIVRALLTSNLTQREIAENLQVSIAKITSGSNELKRTARELKQLLIDFASTAEKK